MKDAQSRWDAAQGRTDVMTEAGFGPPVTWSKFKIYRKQIPVFLKKNRGLITDAEFWRLLPQLRAARAEVPAATGQEPRLWVGTHHKAMTTYFNAVLRFYGYAARRKYQKINLEMPDADTQLFLSGHCKMDMPQLGPYRGAHIMRDPRDMIVSGYHYHKWTYETWTHRPDDNGRSYQKKLQEADTHTGLFMEIDHFIFFYRDLLENWNMDDPDIVEVRYEDLMGDDREERYHEIFTHFGGSQAQIDAGVALMRLFEAKRRTGRATDAAKAKHQHIRSGRKEQWREELSADHLDYIEAQLGPVLRKFGYEPH